MNNAFFYIYETVDFPLVLTSEDGQPLLNDISNVMVSLRQSIVLVEKDLSSSDISLDTENNTINLHLSQEDTGKFKQGNAVIQVNLLYTNTERDTSVQGTITVLDNLHKKVM